MAQGDATGGERIGVAFVDVEARLETAKKQLDQFERDSSASVSRVKQAGSGTADSFRETGDAADEAGVSILNLISLGGVFYRVWSRGLMVTITQFKEWLGMIAAANGALGATIALAKGLMRAFLPLAVAVAIVNGIAVAIEGVAAGLDIARRSTKQFGDALSSDAERAKEGVRGVANELERIPIVGGLVAAKFQAEMGTVRHDMDMVSEAVLRLRDYLLDIPIAGRLLFEPLDQIANAFAGHRDAAQQVVDTIRDQAEHLERVKRISEETTEMMQGAAEQEQRLRRQMVDEQLSGVEAIAEAERRRNADAKERFDDDMRRLRELHNEEVGSIRERRRMGEEVATTAMTSEQGREALQAKGIEGGLIDTDARAREMSQAAEAQLEAAMQQRREAFQRFGMLSAEAATQATQEAVESEQREMMRGQDEIEALRLELLENRLRLEDRTFQAQAVAIHRNYRAQILEAERDGEHERARLLRQLSEERIRQVEQQAEAEAEARTEKVREQGERIAEEIRAIERDIARQGIDDDAMREAFGIDTQFQDRIADVTDRMAELREEIDAIREAGPGQGERDRLLLMQQQLEALEHQRDRLGVLRDMKLSDIDLNGEESDRVTGQLAREIGRDRISVGEGLVQPQEVKSKQLTDVIARLEEIRENTQEGEGFG